MELFRLLGTVAIENSEANEAIDETTEKAESSHGRIGAAFEKIGSAAVAVGKTIATGLAVGSAAVAALTKSALDGYADYEQLVGGVETLFKTSADMVQGYADRAYKTAGLSANEYMETVTSFSASLLQSLGGNTKAAADMADMAIIDMSDNANKMGSNMSSIQNAYQGFAKQNYSMLDNLKLGYGGTQAEMYRLLEDATKLNSEFAETADFSIDKKGHLEAKFSDIVQAIHIVQSEMGITGTTALEASETISGSLASMKSSWKNLLTGLGNEDADLSGLTDQFIASTETAMGNVLPRIGTILGGITNLLAQIIPMISEKLPELLSTMLPSLIQAAVQLFNGLVAALPTILQILIEQLPYICTEIGKGLVSAFPVLLETAKSLFGQIWDYISLGLLNTGVSFEDALGGMGEVFSIAWAKMQEIWAATGQPIWDAIVYAFQYVKENWDSISASVSTVFGILWDYCKVYWENIGQPIWDMISYAINFVMDLFRENMPAIMGFFQNAVAGIKDTWENHLKPAFEAIGAFLNDKVKPAFEYVFEKIISPLIKNVFSYIANLWNNTLKPVFDGICDFITGVFTLNWEKMGDGILAVFGGLWEGIKSRVTFIKDFLSDVFGNVKDDIAEKLTAAKDAVWDIFDKIRIGVTNKIDGAKDAVRRAIDKIKGFFDFEFKLPKLKAPHFSITPSGWKVGDLLDGIIPKLGVEWYAKGGVMTEPTIFGRNGNNAMIGGEAGAEAIAPIDVLQGYVAQAVASQNAALVAVLEKILGAVLALDENMGGNMREALEGASLEVNHREFARLVKAVN